MKTHHIILRRISLSYNEATQTRVHIGQKFKMCDDFTSIKHTLPWYGWKNDHLALNNNHSRTHSNKQTILKTNFVLYVYLE